MEHGALRDLAARHTALHADAAGFAATAIPGLNMVRATATMALSHVIYRPLVCLILQGAKQVMTGTDRFDFTEGQAAIITADVPALSRITAASRVVPYLAVAIDLDMSLLHELAPMVSQQVEPGTASPVHLDVTDASVTDAALRLVRLLDRPEAIAILQTAILREFHYWLVAGRHGHALRRLATPDSQASRIARAVSALRAGFDRPLHVGSLAGIAGMSVSSFHQHFRAITSLSPIQFQKQLRLIEARRLMIIEARPASQAAFGVGYESVQQFTREYGRMFGSPPAADVRRNRLPAVAAQA